MQRKPADIISDANIIGPAPVFLVDSNNNLYTASGGGGGSSSDIVATGNLTSASGAGSTVQLQLGTGQATWEAQLTGTFSSGTTIAFQGSDDASSPTNWRSAVGYDSSLTNPVPITQISGPGPFIIRGAASGYQYIQMVCTALHSGDNVAVRLIGSTGALAGGGPVTIPDGGNIVEGSTTDANTVNSVMGRLTKIRDLLNAALAVNATQSGTWTVQPGNTQNTTPWLVNAPSSDIIVFPSGAQTTTQTQADQTNNTARGIIVVLDMTNAAANPSVTLEIDGKDIASGKYYPLLKGAAVTTVSTNVYTIFPGAANAQLPHTWRIKVVANNSNSATYSVGASLLP